mgnify:CR=1 FL=1
MLKIKKIKLQNKIKSVENLNKFGGGGEDIQKHTSS